MIDLHSHLLPGIDDGPPTMQESLKMARIYEGAGYHQVVATPHWIPGTPWISTPAEIRNKVDELNEFLRYEKVSLEVLPGMEIALEPDIPAFLDKGTLQPLGGKSYVLIETPYQMLPLGWEQVFFEIISKGYNILLAHPERCAQLASHHHLIDALKAADVCLQINWDSFLGYQGRETAKLARYMAAKGYISCLATDSHDPDNRNAGSVQRAALEVENLVGRQNLQLLAGENPARVLNGESLAPMDITDVQKKPKRTRRWLPW
jgi:protein-tyrosine phosphatase